jgi:hypothetical protein
MKRFLFFAVTLSVSVPISSFAEENSIDQSPSVNDSDENVDGEIEKSDSSSSVQNENLATSQENDLPERTFTQEDIYPQ